MNRVILALAVIAVPAALLLSACGGGGDTATPTPPLTPTEPPTITPTTPTPPPPTAEIGTDKINLLFDKDSLTVSAGSEVVLEFSNNSVSFEHNWVLVEAGTKDEVAADALQHKDNDYIPPDDDRIIAHTRLLDSGETGVITFTAPATPGTYEFICTFPGHSTTMFGQFEVTS